MKQLVLLKSYSRGINLILDEQAEFDALLREIALKFQTSADFFKDAKLALSMEGRKLTNEEVNQIISVIEENSKVHVVCIVDKNEDKNKIYIKALEQLDLKTNPPQKPEDCQIHLDTVRDGETLECETSLLILGNVESGALVVSRKSVFVLGTLRGEVFAGSNADESAVILALDFNPTRIKIGPYRINDQERKGKHHFGKKQPQIAYLEQDKILVEAVKDSLWSKLFAIK